MTLPRCRTPSATGPGGVSVRAFGDFVLAINGRTVSRWRAGKARQLVQYLLLNRGTVLSKDTLSEALWPGSSWAQSSTSLKVAVHAVRGILAAQGEHHSTCSACPSLSVHTRGSGYLLDAQGVRADYETFDEVMDRAAAAEARSDPEADDLYESAVRLYRGDYLPATAAPWADVQREWLRGRVLTALERLTERALAGADSTAVIRNCHRALAIDPLREEAYRALFVAYGRHGRLAEVRRWHEICATRLRDHLRVTPDAATERLYSLAMGRSLVGADLAGMSLVRLIRPDRAR